MKSTNKFVGLILIFVLVLALCACGKTEITNRYDISRISASGNPSNDYIDTRMSFMSDGLCVTDSDDIDNPDINPVYIEAAGAFNISIIYSREIIRQVPLRL